MTYTKVPQLEFKSNGNIVIGSFEFTRTQLKEMQEKIDLFTIEELQLIKQITL